MKSGRISTMMQLAQKGVCDFSWLYPGKNAYALYGQRSKQAMQMCTTKKSHFPPVKRAILKSCKNQKCRTGHGEQGAFIRWWAVCELPRATLEKCMVVPKSSKNRATEHRTLPIMGVYLGKSKNQQDTSTPQFRATLFTRTSTSVHLKYPRKENNG